MAMARHLGSETFWVRVLAAMVCRCVIGQDTSPVCVLSRPTSEGYLVGKQLLEYVFEYTSCAAMAAGLFASQGAELVVQQKVSINRGKLYWLPSCLSFLSPPPLPPPPPPTTSTATNNYKKKRKKKTKKNNNNNRTAHRPGTLC